ncbi:TRAP transporter small permease [Brumicola pallidula]|jgi:TRAP-type C4-dicarboxylate transport system permease small subunit|uniref:TRAP transporter small permease protein n=1 Tax=Brumicola pallidula DSM 14239 = ACAM 615 TaxID=1121922 RepID=K6ZN47_9ALTE|nr:TRAP transporter small permease [Glaciecola pallidula]GAC30288.1 tripartite ATP-independent periplasmic transporter DctQ [Glaciecola pallidula DSM 14239 = ACAM 615]
MMSFIIQLNTVLGVLNFHIARSAKYLAGFLLALMVVMILAQVVFRYVLNDSLTWTEELSKFAMVWIACLVSPWAYREHLNVSIEMFHDALPVLPKRIAEIIITILIMLISAIFFVQSISFVAGGMTITAASVQVKLWFFYLCMPFAFGSLFLVGVERIIQQLSSPLIPHHGGTPNSADSKQGAQ